MKQSGEPDAPASMSLLLRVLHIHHAVATTQNVLVSPSQVLSVTLSLLQSHTESDPQTHCCLRAQRASPLLHVPLSAQHIQYSTKICTSRWMQKGTQRERLS